MQKITNHVLDTNVINLLLRYGRDKFTLVSIADVEGEIPNVVHFMVLYKSDVFIFPIQYVPFILNMVLQLREANVAVTEEVESK